MKKRIAIQGNGRKYTILNAQAKKNIITNKEIKLKKKKKSEFAPQNKNIFVLYY